ncbi:MAG TPA: hypothetical protein VKR06_34420 [Ktedonosporobacter sp.]|nr:hypothetical protein [Ktedonosporobacter sp.]
MHTDFIVTAGILLSMVAVAVGFIGFAALLTCPHAFAAGLIWAMKRMGKKRRKR